MKIRALSVFEGIVYHCWVTDRSDPCHPTLEVEAVLRDGDADSGPLLLSVADFVAMAGGMEIAAPCLRTFDAELTGKVAQESLDTAGITLNKNTIPDDPRSPFVTSGLRLGTASVTTAGMTETEMPVIARLIGEALKSREEPEALSAIRKEVGELCAKFPPYPSK